MDFAGKCVVITGGATGIGFALAKRLGVAGARLILCEPREAKLAEAVAALTRLGIDARAFTGDVTDAASVEALADFAWGAHGRADAIIATPGSADRASRLSTVTRTRRARCSRSISGACGTASTASAGASRPTGCPPPSMPPPPKMRCSTRYAPRAALMWRASTPCSG